MPDPNLHELSQWLTAQQETHGGLVADLLRIAAASHPGDDPTDRLRRIRRADALAAEVEKTLARITDVRHEYMVLWHASDDDDAISMTESQLPSLARALRVGPDKVGQYGIIRFTVQFAVHVRFDDDSTWISAWEPVDYRGPLFPCPTCGATVFRGSASDSVSLLLVDAEPVADGELVLVPNVEHGGEPAAVYGTDHRPGIRHYHRHPDDCGRSTHG